jgi:hypothetical protein
MDDAAIIDLALKQIRAEFGADLLGVLAGGSRMRGEGGPNSDLDVVVVVGRPRRRRWNIVIAGVEVETFVNPPFQMKRYFEEDRKSGKGLMPHLCSTGRILFDPQGVMAMLQAEAVAIWDAGPAPVSERDRWYFRYGAADILRDIDDVMTSDAERALFLVGLLLPQLVDQHYRIAGRWLHKRKRVLDDLALWDAPAAAMARQACSITATVRQRYMALLQLADHVLAPLGGIMPSECSTEWEELSETKSEPRAADA